MEGETTNMDDWIRAATEGNMPPTQVVDMYWKDHYGNKNPYRFKSKMKNNSPRRQHFDGVSNKKTNFNNADYQRLLVKSRNITSVRNKSRDMFSSSNRGKRDLSRWPENQISPRSPRGGGWSTNTKLRDSSPRGRPTSPRGRPTSPRANFNKPKQTTSKHTPQRPVRPGTGAYKRPNRDPPGTYKRPNRDPPRAYKRPTRDPYTNNAPSRQPTKVQYQRNTCANKFNTNHHNRAGNAYDDQDRDQDQDPTVVIYREHTIVHTGNGNGRESNEKDRLELGLGLYSNNGNTTTNGNTNDSTNTNGNETLNDDGIDMNKVKQMEKRVYELYGIPTWVVGDDAGGGGIGEGEQGGLRRGNEHQFQNSMDVGDRGGTVEQLYQHRHEDTKQNRNQNQDNNQKETITNSNSISMLGNVMSNAKQWLTGGGGGKKIHPGNASGSEPQPEPRNANPKPNPKADGYNYDENIINGVGGNTGTGHGIGRNEHDTTEQTDVWNNYKKMEFDRMLIDNERISINRNGNSYSSGHGHGSVQSYSPFSSPNTNTTNPHTGNGQVCDKTEMNYHDEHKHIVSNRNNSYEHLKIPMELLGGFGPGPVVIHNTNTNKNTIGTGKMTKNKNNNTKRPLSAGGISGKPHSNPYLLNRPSSANSKSSVVVISRAKTESGTRTGSETETGTGPDNKFDQIRTNHPFSSGNPTGNPTGTDIDTSTGGKDTNGGLVAVTSNSTGSTGTVVGNEVSKKESHVCFEDSLDKEVVKEVVKPKHPLFGGGGGGLGGGINFLDALKNSKSALKKTEKKTNSDCSLGLPLPLTAEQLVTKDERIKQYKVLEMTVNRLYLPIVAYSEFQGTHSTTTTATTGISTGSASEVHDTDIRHSLLGRGKFAAVYKAKCTVATSTDKMRAVHGGKSGNNSEFVCALKMSQYRYKPGTGYSNINSTKSSPSRNCNINTTETVTQDTQVHSFAASSAKFSSNVIGHRHGI